MATGREVSLVPAGTAIAGKEGTCSFTVLQEYSTGTGPGRARLPGPGSATVYST